MHQADYLNISECVVGLLRVRGAYFYSTIAFLSPATQQTQEKRPSSIPTWPIETGTIKPSPVPPDHRASIVKPIQRHYCKIKRAQWLHYFWLNNINNNSLFLRLLVSSPGQQERLVFVVGNRRLKKNEQFPEDEFLVIESEKQPKSVWQAFPSDSLWRSRRPRAEEAFESEAAVADQRDQPQYSEQRDACPSRPAGPSQ